MEANEISYFHSIPPLFNPLLIEIIAVKTGGGSAEQKRSQAGRCVLDWIKRVLADRPVARAEQTAVTAAVAANRHRAPAMIEQKTNTWPRVTA